jgi:large subunit ribosomal protein L31
VFEVKPGIHPEYVDSTFICSCGATFKTRSAKPEVHLELCSQCHPFYTGKQKFVDTGGRVQRFEDKFAGAATTVLEKQAAEKEARRKAAEEAALKAKQEREAKAAEKAAKASKYEVAEAVGSGKATAEVIEGSRDATGDIAIDEPIADEPVAEEAVEVEASAEVAEEPAAEEPVAQEAPAEEPAAEDEAPAEESAE